LQNVGDIFKAIDGVLEELVNFFQLDQRNGILLLVKKVGDSAAADQIGFVFQRVDLNAMLEDWALLFQCLQGLFGRSRTTVDNTRQLHHVAWDGVDFIRNQAVSAVFDAIEHIVEGAGDVVNILGVERRDERLVESLENIVDDFITAAFQDTDSGSGSGQTRIPNADAFQKDACRRK
jgi:hypothetical protein